MSGLRAGLAPSCALALVLLTAQCASVQSTRARTSAGARTYQGLTLEEWRAIPWVGKGRIRDGDGEVTFGRDVVRAIEALREFARESDEALADLRRLGRDLSEDVREEAGDALVELAFSDAPNHGQAMEALMGLVADGDSLVSAAAMGQTISYLEDEDADWERLGPERESELVRRVEFLLTANGDEELGIALEAIDVLAARSAGHERSFAAMLAQPARLRAPDAAEELNDLAWDLVKPSLPRAERATLALAAARAAAALAPEDPRCMDTLAIANWRLGKRAEALTAARQAVAAAAILEQDERNDIEGHLEMLGREESWATAAPDTPR
jgi:Flp pilus assembly protein TadD